MLIFNVAFKFVDKITSFILLSRYTYCWLTATVIVSSSIYRVVFAMYFLNWEEQDSYATPEVENFHYAVKYVRSFLDMFEFQEISLKYYSLCFGICNYVEAKIALEIWKLSAYDRLLVLIEYMNSVSEKLTYGRIMSYICHQVHIFPPTRMPPEP